MARVRALVRRHDRALRRQPARRRDTQRRGGLERRAGEVRGRRGLRRVQRRERPVGQQEPASQQFLLIVSSPIGPSTIRPSRPAIADIVARMAALQATVDGATGPVFEQLVDPTAAPPPPAWSRPTRPRSGSSARVPGDGAVLVARLDPVPALVDEIRAAHPGLPDPRAQQHARQRRDQRADQQRPRRVAPADDPAHVRDPADRVRGASSRRSCRSSSPITALLAAFGILGLYSQVVAPVSPYASQLVVLIGLAVAVDYSLFMVTRFRTERRHGRDKLARSTSRAAPPGGPCSSPGWP